MTTHEQLAELTAQEEELMRVVVGLSGSMEAKHQTLLDTGVYARYAAIHATYTELAAQNEEALKRAIFILWYSLAEPECFTGIFSLSESATEQAGQLLQQLVTANELDEEWRWMLPWYYRLTDYAFGNWTAQPAFQQLLTGLPNQAWNPHPVLFPLEARGRMGSYWLSIQESHARFRSLGLGLA